MSFSARRITWRATGGRRRSLVGRSLPAYEAGPRWAGAFSAARAADPVRRLRPSGQLCWFRGELLEDAPWTTLRQLAERRRNWSCLPLCRRPARPKPRRGVRPRRFRGLRAHDLTAWTPMGLHSVLVLMAAFQVRSSLPSVWPKPGVGRHRQPDPSLDRGLMRFSSINSFSLRTSRAIRPSTILLGSSCLLDEPWPPYAHQERPVRTGRAVAARPRLRSLASLFK